MTTSVVEARTETPGGRPSTRAVVWGTAVVVLGAGAWRPAWSGDEAATVMVVRRPLAQILLSLDHDPALVPYYLLANLWAYPSTGHLWMRLLSVLAMATAGLATAVLAERLGGPRLGVLAATVMLALPAVSRYGQDARPYALSVLAVVGLVLFWHAGLTSWRRRAAAAGLVAVLGLLQPYGLLIVPVLLLVSAVAPRTGRTRPAEVLAIAGSAAVGILLVSPHLLRVADRAIGQVDPPPVTVRNLAEEVLRLPVAVLAPPMAPVLAVLVLLLTATGTAVAWRHGDRRLAVLVAAWAALPPLLLCLTQVLTGSPGLVARYWTCCLPALALGSAITLQALGRRRHSLGVTVVTVMALLGLPAQLAIRGVDGHQGQRWRDLSYALAHPTLEGAPLLVKGWSYRALVSNDPELAERMVLVVDPAIDGRVNPSTHGTDTPVFARLLQEHGRVIVLQDEAGYGRKLPGRRAFPDFRAELKPFPLLPVRCAYFGEPLGVFTTPEAALGDDEAADLARHIEGVAPARVRCAADA
jgi:mannosyltransferase